MMINELEKEIRSNSKISTFLRKLNGDQATQEDVSNYGAELGECVASVINNHINPKMELADLMDMAMPLFMEVFEKVYYAASHVQESEDRKKGIGIKPIKPEFPEEKIRNLIRKIYSILEEQNNGG